MPRNPETRQSRQRQQDWEVHLRKAAENRYPLGDPTQGFERDFLRGDESCCYQERQAMLQRLG